jgi:anti-anti-sigma factor
MKITESPSKFDPRVTHLHFQGELNAPECESVTQVFQGLLDAQKYFIIAVMEDVSFMASPFLGALMGCKLRLAEKGGNLVLVGLSFPLREKLILMGADKIFQFYPDVPSAYHRFNWEYSDGTQSLRMTLPPRLHIIPAARRFLSGVARQKGYSSRDAFRIETLVDEIANNAIEHGDPSQPNIYLEAKISRRKLELLVRNYTRMDKVGQLREIVESNRAVLRGQASRGRGLALVKLISHSINVSIDKAGTCVSITKLREDA